MLQNSKENIIKIFEKINIMKQEEIIIMRNEEINIIKL